MTLVESSGLPADAFSAKCPTRQVLDHIANKWTVLIVDCLAAGPLRYNQVRRRIDGISQKMLTQTLQGLAADGFVHRTQYATVPPRVEYELTELGQSLREPISAIREWTEKHINEVERARAGLGSA
ncbi:helix-turn-helix transcriptional regulator [Kribbella sp. NBC_01505]|uniref:winged helix-turn-helix transcriptional regulator n=1 Tax=Kribbella sp. NBC_01505 TaxID=2903580 RepID=UPI0038642A63